MKNRNREQTERLGKSAPATAHFSGDALFVDNRNNPDSGMKTGCSIIATPIVSLGLPADALIVDARKGQETMPRKKVRQIAKYSVGADGFPEPKCKVYGEPILPKRPQAKADAACG